ncbi:hypothetical protein PTKIN_Ptkin02bG0154100 [Pterospermum kingtungense]
MSMDMAERIGNKIGTFKTVDHNPTRPGWGRNLRLGMEIDIFKPLSRFVSIPIGRNKDDVWGRLGHERLPLFYCGCGKIGHSEFECEMAGSSNDTDAVKQYGDWLRASLGL